MPARPIGSGTISFGLVSIPVKIFSATQSKAGISFHLFHAKDGARLREQYVCAKDGAVVPREEIVKGYELEKGRHVTFSPKEIKELEDHGSGSIDVSEFVPDDRIDPTYFDRSYYLGPDKGGAKAYRLFAQALLETKRLGLGLFALRGKQHLVVLRPHEGGLILQQLLYAAEVRPFSEVPHEGPAVKAPELKLAVELIERGATEAFRPERYNDAWVERTRKLIERKGSGEATPEGGGEEPSRGKVVDLMEALKASLGSSARRGATTGSKARAAETPPGRRARRRAPARARRAS
jgi:DNA end-binding protein Ku